MNQHFTLPVLAMLASMPLMAQTDLSVFSTTGRAAATTFVTDYQAIGINPANLGWAGRYPDKHLCIGLAEGTYSIYSEALTRSDLRKRFLHVDQPFTQDEKVDAAKKIANAGFTLNADVMLLGAAYRTDPLGGLGFQVHDRVQWSSVFGPLASDLIFLGSSSNYFDQLILANGDTIPNTDGLSQATIDQIVQGIRSNDPYTLSKALDGSRIAFNWYREFNLSYGRSIVHNDGLDLYAGVGVKFLLGVGIIDVASKNGKLTAYSALSPFFDIDYGTAANSNPSRLSGTNGLLPKSAGKGFGMDLGLSAIIHGKLKVGMALTNLGSIAWDGNVYEAKDALLTELSSDGMDSYNFFDGIDDYVTNSGIMEWKGESSRKVPLPANLRTGAGWVIGDLAEVGVDVVLPMNDEPGSYGKAVIGAGGDIRPLEWLQLSAGVVTGGDYDTKIPVGITFNVAKGTWEFGVASRDAVTFFADTRPTLSLSMGFLRFRF